MSEPEKENLSDEGVTYQKNSHGRIVSVTVDLFFPLEDMAPQVTKLKFRRMKAKDTLVAEDIENKAKAGYALYARLANIDPDIFEEIDVEDVERISDAILPLMGKSARRLLEEERTNAIASDGET